MGLLLTENERGLMTEACRYHRSRRQQREGGPERACLTCRLYPRGREREARQRDRRRFGRRHRLPQPRSGPYFSFVEADGLDGIKDAGMTTAAVISRLAHRRLSECDYGHIPVSLSGAGAEASVKDATGTCGAKLVEKQRSTSTVSDFCASAKELLYVDFTCAGSALSRAQYIRRA